MKKTAFVFLGILVSALCFAQRSHTSFGLKAGVNIADFNDAARSTDPRIGFHVGGLAHIHLDPNWALQPELTYSAQGAKFGGGTYKVDYVNIPLLFQYMFANGLRLETGPQIGIRTNVKWKDENGVEVNKKGEIKSSDVAWDFGLGYISPSGLGVDARYNLGITDISTGPGELKNRVWQFGVFYQFR